VKPGKAFGILTLVLTEFMVLGCVLPHAMFVAEYGRLPLHGRDPFAIPKGSTKDEVRAALGSPHDRSVKDNVEIWYYHGDLFEMATYRMEFDAKGRLVNCWW